MSDELAVVRRAVGGPSPADSEAESLPAIRGGGARGAGPQLEDLVDLVVARIEQRVIDELERRGRRPGGF